MTDGQAGTPIMRGLDMSPVLIKERSSATWQQQRII